MEKPLESSIRLFLSTINEFTLLYRKLNNCGRMTPKNPQNLLPLGQLEAWKLAYIGRVDPFMSSLGKVFFLIFELMVSLMQFNLLIAMMTRTYETISRSEKEWKRQVR